jgi:capsular polysaccharide biosynthesis protein
VVEMVISFNLGDSLKEALINLGVESSEAKRVINEFEVSLEKEIKSEIKNEVANSLKDLPTRDEVNKKFERLESKLDKFLYIVLGFMFSLIAGAIILFLRLNS